MSDGDEVIPANVKEPNLTVETSIKKKKAVFEQPCGKMPQGKNNVMIDSRTGF